MMITMMGLERKRGEENIGLRDEDENSECDIRVGNKAASVLAALGI